MCVCVGGGGGGGRNRIIWCKQNEHPSRLCIVNRMHAASHHGFPPTSTHPFSPDAAAKCKGVFLAYKCVA